LASPRTCNTLATLPLQVQQQRCLETIRPARVGSILAALGTSGILHSLLTLHLHLPWLVVEDFHAIRHLSSKLYKLLMGRVFVYIVVAVLFILKLDYETMG